MSDCENESELIRMCNDVGIMITEWPKDLGQSFDLMKIYLDIREKKQRMSVGSEICAIVVECGE